METSALLKEAAAAAAQAHCPYSKFPVGAALLATDGTVTRGCNVENASFGLTVCAERTAVGSAVVAGKRTFTALAIVGGKDKPVPPCGACRQVLAEFCGPDLVIVLAAPGQLDAPVETTLGDLLPEAFSL